MVIKNTTNAKVAIVCTKHEMDKISWINSQSKPRRKKADRMGEKERTKQSKHSMWCDGMGIYVCYVQLNCPLSIGDGVETVSTITILNESMFSDRLNCIHTRVFGLHISGTYTNTQSLTNTCLTSTYNNTVLECAASAYRHSSNCHNMPTTTSLIQFAFIQFGNCNGAAGIRNSNSKMMTKRKIIFRKLSPFSQVLYPKWMIYHSASSCNKCNVQILLHFVRVAYLYHEYELLGEVIFAIQRQANSLEINWLAVMRTYIFKWSGKSMAQHEIIWVFDFVRSLQRRLALSRVFIYFNKLICTMYVYI